ncbi:SRPBCC family protein [Pseudonocardia zijingensis]|uniref:SRPBCC family protein n=1 Tax=Pseudonocardia zijingensis TaxID=153376 RepID=A0ABN1PMD6_9PSEU
MRSGVSIYPSAVVTVRREIGAAADAVWAVLADGWRYASWVVGASRIRAVDPAWPGVGAQLHHSVGMWPLELDDTTTVLACVPKRELVLRARAWPLGAAEVRLTLEDRADGCEVVFEEDVCAGPGLLVLPPVRSALIGPRNAESLNRLAYLAEGGSR